MAKITYRHPKRSEFLKALKLMKSSYNKLQLKSGRQTSWLRNPVGTDSKSLLQLEEYRYGDFRKNRLLIGLAKQYR